MNEVERDAAIAALPEILDHLKTIKANTTLTAEEVKRHGARLTHLEEDVQGLRASVTTLEQEVRAGVNLSNAVEAPTAVEPLPSPLPPTSAVLAPMRAPSRSVTSEVRESLRATEMETKAQTPMLRQILTGQQGSNARQAVSVFVGMTLAVAVANLVTWCQPAMPASPFRQNPPQVAPAPRTYAPPPAELPAPAPIPLPSPPTR
jgi:hypothetical protein